ncbi:MAG: hypothetical protein LBK18_03700 [Prevotellaceae bacterium]|jgi:hypothetical protein|nr:hypothetical protein [Prevotellaceae bacterium]
MSFCRTSSLAALLILFSGKAATAQTEHHLGMIGGKVVGPIYTLQHNRWNVTTTGGWLTGFKGGYASLTGGYRVFSLLENFEYAGVKLLYGRGIRVDLGLGIFGLGYVAPTLQQKKLARELDYTTPFGVQFIGKIYFNVSPNWSYGMHIGIPLLTNPTEESIGYSDNNSGVALWKGLLYLYQISLQYRLESTGKKN